MDTDSDSAVEDESREQKQKPEFTTLLYDGSDLTVLESHLVLYQFALRHGISKQALTDLVSLVNIHLPQSAKSAPSFYKLKQFLNIILMIWKLMCIIIVPSVTGWWIQINLFAPIIVDRVYRSLFIFQLSHS